MARFKVVLSAAVALLTFASLKAYSADKEPITTFRSSSRLVVVDVVVTGKNEEPVKDLRAEDFTLIEDGKPQQISGFEAHMVKGTPSAAKSSLPPNQFTNAIDVPADAPINILLIDALNSSWVNQATARSSIVHFLTTLPPNTPTAVFVLGDRLRMVQGFTTDSNVLIKAAKDYRPENSQAQTSAAAAESARRIILHTSENASETESLRDVIARMERSNFTIPDLQKLVENEIALNMRNRAEETMAAFKQISRAVSGYSGRKNLIWLSAAFPLDVRPLTVDEMSHSRSESFAKDMREVAQLMTASKVAIYPVDIRGLDPSISLLSRQISTMQVVAEETGGRAFFMRNDIDIAMAKAVELGSSYYTLYYRPQNTKWNGNYRDIKVEVNRKDVKLAYRKGYFAEDAPREIKRLERDVQLAMIDGSPLATGIIMRASVLERKMDGTTVIAYSIPGSQLRLRDKDNQPFAAKYAFGAMGYDKHGKRAGMDSEVWNLPGDAAVVEKMEREGWVHRQTVKISPEAAFLRVAVQDQTTGKIGTVEIPLQSSK